MEKFEFKIITSEKDLKTYYKLREDIFVKEQEIFSRTDIDEYDRAAIHIAAVEKSSARIVGGVRCYNLEGNTWVGGRLSAAPGHRNGLVGRNLVKFAVETVKTKGCECFIAYVQPQNVRFFERLNWKCSGKPIIYEGKPHQMMEAELGDRAAAGVGRKITAGFLKEIIKTLHRSPRLNEKTNIADVWNFFPQSAKVEGKEVRLGDDAAAIEYEGGYLLAAAEGVYQPLLKSNPYLAGKTSVLTNVNDIYSMGGRPVAILDVLCSCDAGKTDQILSGIYDNAARYDVPVIGGHLSGEASALTLAVFILGKAKRLLSSFNAQEGDDLIMVVGEEGRFYSGFNFWDSSSGLSRTEALRHLEILPELAEEQLADAAKDISMAGVIGSVLMLLECSRKGAEIHIDDIPVPPGVELADWLVTFPSYGFVLSLRPERTLSVRKKFRDHGLLCEKIGEVCSERKAYFKSKDNQKELFWDLQRGYYMETPEPKEAANE